MMAPKKGNLYRMFKSSLRNIVFVIVIVGGITWILNMFRLDYSDKNEENKSRILDFKDIIKIGNNNQLGHFPDIAQKNTQKPESNKYINIFKNVATKISQFKNTISTTGHNFKDQMKSYIYSKEENDIQPVSVSWKDFISLPFAPIRNIHTYDNYTNLLIHKNYNFQYCPIGILKNLSKGDYIIIHIIYVLIIYITYILE